SGRINSTVEDTELGLSLTYERVAREIQTITAATFELTEETGAHVSFGWALSVSNSKVEEVNLTATNANLTLSSGRIMDFLAWTFSEIAIENSRVNRTSVQNAHLTANDATLRMTTPGMNTDIQLTDSRCGLSAIYWSQHGEVDLPTGSSFSWENPRIGTHIEIADSEIYDWALAAMGGSNLTLRDEHLLVVEGYQLSNVRLLDPLLETPPRVEDLSRVTVLRSLTIQVMYDFRHPGSAKITVLRGSDTIVQVDATEGRYETVLPQVVVTSSERRDMGDYTIQATVGGFSGRASLYLYEDTSITVWVFGPLTWSLIGMVVVLVAFFVYWIYKKQRRKNT
ncbi:MAG: hypothetical protein GWO20_14530, partial [Candidatus Korarchaeota archaeon]|nr:hypothetical protein [Candidatus Korarchaeota archaeon]NIU84639.1 hypothetical protein [Candidatus Thorarchaeota archaeon]NIW14665.1 hypothetical protein [Candidatus Thorarchaeota archaeon]NIW52741.1 hypothetical protein [Candidatus Korarchaeota archaeon]